MIYMPQCVYCVYKAVIQLVKLWSCTVFLVLTSACTSLDMPRGEGLSLGRGCPWGGVVPGERLSLGRGCPWGEVVPGEGLFLCFWTRAVTPTPW